MKNAAEKCSYLKAGGMKFLELKVIEIYFKGYFQGNECHLTAANWNKRIKPVKSRPAIENNSFLPKIVRARVLIALQILQF